MGQTGTGLNRFYACITCGSDLLVLRDTLQCERCGRTIEVVHGIPRFVKSELHENFGIQWNRFSKVQLDSSNGSTESRDRLLSQSGLTPEYFEGKTILEIGCGAGRFTEVLLSFGASVCSVDFSSAVDANRDSNEAAVESGALLLHLPCFRLVVKSARVGFVRSLINRCSVLSRITDRIELIPISQFPTRTSRRRRHIRVCIELR